MKTTTTTTKVRELTSIGSAVCIVYLCLTFTFTFDVAAGAGARVVTVAVAVAVADVAFVVPLYSIVVINSLRAIKCDRLDSVYPLLVECAYGGVPSHSPRSIHSFVCFILCMYSIRNSVFFFGLHLLFFFIVERAEHTLTKYLLVFADTTTHTQHS